MAQPAAVALRPAVAPDCRRIAEIYAPYVLTTTVTFETAPPDAAEIGRRLSACTVEGYPWIVAEAKGVVVGYAYASRYRQRAAYRHTAEVSVYVDQAGVGQGTGTALLRELVRALGPSGVAALIGSIALPNERSVRLHERLGFRKAGVLHKVGYKFDRWIDVGYWEMAIKDTAKWQPAAAPEREGL